MNIKKLLITEVERKRILQMHGLLKEDDPKVPTTVPEVKNYVYFDAGYHSQNYLGNELEEPLNRVKDYLTNSAGKGFIATVTVSSSESKIPNTDAESGNSPLKPGELALKRSKTIETYITEQLKGFVDSKALLTLPNITVQQPFLGKTEWVGQPFCPADKLSGEDKTVGRSCLNSKFNPGTDSKGKQITNWVNGKKTIYKDIWSAYTQEQYVYVTITVNKKETKEPDELSCLNNMKIMLNYELPGGHVCDSSTYEIYINNNLLRRDGDGRPYASLNNGASIGGFQLFIKKGGKIDNKSIYYYNNDITGPDSKPKRGGARYNSFTINSDLAQSLLGTSKTFQVQAKCINPTNNKDHNGGCHKDLSKIKIMNGTGKITTFEVTTPSKKDELITMVTIDACGNKVT